MQPEIVVRVLKYISPFSISNAHAINPLKALVFLNIHLA